MYQSNNTSQDDVRINMSSINGRNLSNNNSYAASAGQPINTSYANNRSLIDRAAGYAQQTTNSGLYGNNNNSGGSITGGGNYGVGGVGRADSVGGFYSTGIIGGAGGNFEQDNKSITSTPSKTSKFTYSGMYFILFLVIKKNK